MSAAAGLAALAAVSYAASGLAVALAAPRLLAGGWDAPAGSRGRRRAAVLYAVGFLAGLAAGAASRCPGVLQAACAAAAPVAVAAVLAACFRPSGRRAAVLAAAVPAFAAEAFAQAFALVWAACAAGAPPAAADGACRLAAAAAVAALALAPGPGGGRKAAGTRGPGFSEGAASRADGADLGPLCTRVLRRFAYAMLPCFLALVGLSPLADAAGRAQGDTFPAIVLCVVVMTSWLLANANEQAARARLAGEQARAQRDAAERGYRALADAYARNARLYHDMRNHLGAIGNLVRGGDGAGALAYIEGLAGEGGLPGEVPRLTGDRTLDGLVAAKLERCRAAGVDADADIEFPPNAGIAPADLCAVVGNLLDNAVEGACRVPEGRPRWLRVAVRRVNRLLVVKVENAAAGPVAGLEGGGLPATSKDGGHHGWGLESVRSTVERYDGALRLESRPDSFCAVATMCFDGVAPAG